MGGQQAPGQRHDVSTHATAWGWGWGCACGKQGSGTSAPSPQAAKAYGLRHVAAAWKAARKAQH